MEILTFESPRGKEVFEPKELQNGNGFIQAKDCLNTQYLTSGIFSKKAYHQSLVRPANENERNDYQQLKDHSKFTLNATE